MKYFSLVAEVQAPEELEEEQLHVVRVEGARMLLHVATEVSVLGGEGEGGDGYLSVSDDCTN